MRFELCLVLSLALSSAAKSPCDLPERAGYDCKSYSVETADGFTLALSRLNSDGDKGAVYLQHGLMDSSDTFFLNGKKASLGLQLADAGFDVFFGNSRGNQYSPCSDWDWNFDQMAEYDLPATISKVKRISGANKVLYVGHSQGTAILFAALSTGWVDAQDLSVFVALAPPVALRNQRSLLFETLGKLGADKLLALIGPQFTLTLDVVNSLLAGKYTDTYDLVKCIFGPSTNLQGSDWKGHFPEPTSSQNVAHWVQEARSGEFQHYKKHWLQPTEYYEVTDIPRSLPIAILYGSNDLLADTVDVQNLAGSLRNVFTLKQIDGYAHMDFTWALSAKDKVNAPVIDILEQHDPSLAASTGHPPRTTHTPTPLAPTRPTTLLSDVHIVPIPPLPIHLTPTLHRDSPTLDPTTVTLAAPLPPMLLLTVPLLPPPSTLTNVVTLPSPACPVPTTPRIFPDCVAPHHAAPPTHVCAEPMTTMSPPPPPPPPPLSLWLSSASVSLPSLSPLSRLSSHRVVTVSHKAP